MESIPSDLQAKYQKLAAEFSKIRSQASVLKKAVVDEQSKNAELKDLLKDKEQSLRKVDQEMESLNFRNQQLTKRVTVLQEELEIQEKQQGKKGRNKTTDEEFSHNLNSKVIDEELEKKITENARLVSMMQEKDEEHARLTQQLMERVQSLEREVQQFQRASSDVEAKYKVKLEELLSEKSRLSETVGHKQRDVQQYSAQVAALQLQQERLQTDLGAKLQTASHIIRTRLPFIDSQKNDLNELNVPSHNRQQQTWSLQMIAQVGCFICDLTSQLSDFHTYTEQRLHVISDSVSPVATKLSCHLKENARYLRALEQGYKEFQAGLDSGVIITLETIPSLHFFADKLDKYTNYLHKLLPYQLLSLEEESSLPLCGDILQHKNEKLGNQILAFTNCFVKINSYVKLLALQSKRTRQHPQMCQRRFLGELICAMDVLHTCVQGLVATYKEKSQLESEMATSTERLRSTNECLVNSLVTMLDTTKELHAVLNDNKSKILKGRRSDIKSHPAVADFKSRASSYLKCLDEEEPPSVPYKVALRQRQECEGNNKEALGEQLEKAQQRATQIEQDREHWRHEFQLLQMKHTKEQQRSRDLEEQLQLSRSSATTPQSEGSCEVMADAVSLAPSADQQEPTTVTSLLGSVTLATSAESEARENEVKTFFTQRINQLVAQRQLSDGKSTSLQAECLALHERLERATQDRSVAEDRLHAAELSLTKLQEELHTTTHNYESQLSMMSEHLANMNEKLTVQKDEIDQLKYQLTQKGAKKR